MASDTLFIIVFVCFCAAALARFWQMKRMPPERMRVTSQRIRYMYANALQVVTDDRRQRRPCYKHACTMHPHVINSCNNPHTAKATKRVSGRVTALYLVNVRYIVLDQIDGAPRLGFAEII